MIAVVDYGAGNVTSVVKALVAVGADVRVVSAPGQAAGTAGLVVPGVGHFGATRTFDEQWHEPVQRAIDAGLPVLGICLGMHWLFEGSDEAPAAAGLGRLAGRCFRLEGPVKIPHVGWNSLDAAERGTPLLAGIEPGVSAYFTHSFAAPLTPFTLATTTHGTAFTSVVALGRVFGVQFHPEKSGWVGLRLLANFLHVVREAQAPCWPAA